MKPFRIDKELLDELTRQAQASERKRMNFDLRDSAEEESMRMLNAIEPETVIPIHRHTMTSEDVVVLRGKAQEVLFDVRGNELDSVIMETGTDCTACHVPKGVYHTCRSLVSGTVIIEFKTTKYDRVKSEELLETGMIYEAKDGKYGEEGSVSWENLKQKQ